MKLFNKLGILLLLQLLSFDFYGQQGAIVVGLEYVDDAQAIVADAQKITNSIDAAFDKVTESNLYKTIIDGDAISFPFGVLPDNGNKNYALVVNSMSIGAEGATAEIYAKIPFRDKHLYFLADRVPLSKSGTIEGELKLFLMKETNFDVGDGYDITFKGLDNKNNHYSYISFTCDGFKEVYLNGKFNFKDKAVVKKDTTGKVTSTEKVELDFFVNADRTENFIVQFKDVPKFEFKNLKGFTCEVPDFTLDMSDVKNAPDFKLPDWYLAVLERDNDADFDVDLYTSGLWEGVYIPSIRIEIPRKFKEGTDTISALIGEDLIVDASGVTVDITATNILKGGNMKGFKYSLDTVRIGITKNTLTKGGFAGEIALPICKTESTVGFGLTISQNVDNPDELDYKGFATIEGNLEADAFGLAKLKLTQGRLDFEHKNNQFFPKATITGAIVISPKKKDDEPEAEAKGQIGIEFDGLIIESQSPYVSLADSGYLRLLVSDTAKSDLGRMPVSIDNAAMINSEGGQRVGMQLQLTVSLQKSKGGDSDGANGFGGKAKFTIWSRRKLEDKKFKYDGFDLNSIDIKVDNKSFSLIGSLSMFDNDPLYGKGFCGYLDLKLIDKIQVKGGAIFGKIPDVEAAEGTESSDPVDANDGYRYWFLDAMVAFSPAIPVFTGVELNSFTGGIYSNMSMLGPYDKLPPGKKASTVECKTASGRTFIPENNVFGVLAGIGIQSSGGGSAYNGNINFGIEFFTDGRGLKRIATWGGVEVMIDLQLEGLQAMGDKMNTAAKLDEVAEKKEEKQSESEAMSSSIALNWYVEYDFPNKTLTGDFSIFVNLADVITGVGEDGLAGRVSIYSSPSEWYLYVGRPTEMVGVSIAGFLDIGGYMCIGSVLPDPPIAPLPPEIKPKVNIDYSLLNTGGGISFGGRVVVDGDFAAPLIFCKLKAGIRVVLKLGFDVLLSKSTAPIYCSDEYPERGIRNWYATGQAFIYGEAALYASWDCLLGSGSKDLFSMFLSAYIFAQLPRPAYIQGEARVGFKLLGKEHSTGIDMQFGEMCNPPKLLDSSVEFISGIDPSDSTTNVATSKTINVYFSEPVFKFQFVIADGDGERVTHRTYIQEDYIELWNGSQSIEFTTEMSKDNKSIAITPKEALPELSDITVNVKLMLQKQNKESWTKTDVFEERSISFTTMLEPDHIPTTDVYYSYPLVNMGNMYKNESTEGYIRLAVIPQKPVQLDESHEFAVAIFEYENEIDRSTNVTYDPTFGGNNFTFSIPTTRLKKGGNYTLRIMRSYIRNNTEETFTEGERAGTSYGTAEIDKSDHVILQYPFRTSKYGSFNEKMALFNTSLGEVFDGVIVSELSLSKLKEAGAEAFEALSPEETFGHIKEGITVVSPMVKFGKTDYNNSDFNAIQASIDSKSEVLVDHANHSLQVISPSMDDVNGTIKDLNLKCLLDGGCTKEDMKEVVIPSGPLNLEIQYFLPGKTNASSTYNLLVDIDKELTFPY